MNVTYRTDKNILYKENIMYISIFSDEFYQDIYEVLPIIKEWGMTHVDFRGMINGKPIEKQTDEELYELKAALDSLTPDEKQIVLLSVIGRYKSSEIAEIMDMKPGSVRSKLSRSLEKMRDILK